MTAGNWAAGAIALCSALVFTPLVRRVCLALNLYDPPGALKIHSLPTPRLGGISLATALALGVCFTIQFPFRPLWPFFLAIAPIWFTGFLDDLYSLSLGVRLIAQIAGATILWHAGYRLPLPGNIAFSYLATCVVVTIFVNAMNFLDGADGLAVGTAAMIATGYILSPAKTLSGMAFVVAWSLLGACLGFLVFNFPPATVFMGDSGSTLLGFSLAYLALDFYTNNVSAHSYAPFPILIAAVPLLDAVLSVARRLRNFRSPFFGDRGHFYDRMRARSWPPWSVALACYSLTALLVAAGLLSVNLRFAVQVLIAALCLGGLLAGALRLGVLDSSEIVSGLRREKLGGVERVLLAAQKRNDSLAS